MTTLRIHVRYPVGSDTLVLRASTDWDADVLPVDATTEGAVFEVPLAGASVELKPCLRRGGDLHWAVGENYVLSAHDPDPEIWPYFFDAARGAVGPLLQVEGQGRSHAVRVYTPPGYAENTLRTYPVLYLQDGRNLFFPEEAFGGQEWHVDETMDRLDQMNAARKVIVVGVAPRDRMEDYTAPGYGPYVRFLAEVLKPRMDAEFRTRTGPADTVVGGSSLGGGRVPVRRLERAGGLRRRHLPLEHLRPQGRPLPAHRERAAPAGPGLPRQRLAAGQLRSHQRHAGPPGDAGLRTRRGPPRVQLSGGQAPRELMG